MIVFDLTNEDSFTNLDRWRSDFMKKSNSKTENYPFLIVGNKHDLPDERVISKERIEAYCKEAGGLRFVETSAKDNYQVENAFKTLTK